MSAKNGICTNLDEQQQNVIVDGAFAIVQKVGGDHLRLCRLFSGQKVLIERLNFDPTNAIGKPFGMFEVALKGILTPAIINPDIDGKMPQDNVAKNNGHLLLEAHSNLNTVKEILTTEKQRDTDDIIVRQKLTMEKILEFKNDGIATTDLVSKLVEGNSSFQERTLFSKQKYVRKKARKHSDHIMIFPPSIRRLCQVYFQKNPERIAHLRLDQLGSLLQYCTIHAENFNILVYEQTLGLLGAAILERLAGSSNCIFLHRGDWPQSIPCIDAMEFDEQHLQAFLPLRITTLLKPESLNFETNIPAEINCQTEQNQSNLDEEAIIAKRPRLEINESHALQQSKNNSLQLKKLQRTGKERRALDLINSNDAGVNEGKLDAICLATRTFDPVDVLKKVCPGLRLSGRLVIYSPFKQHLLAAWQWLRSTNSFIDIQLCKQFHRAHQVLPNRTHPIMQQAVTGGYILYATKVVPPPVQNPQRKLIKSASSAAS